MAIKKLPRAELQIMKEVWKLEGEFTTKEIAEKIENNLGWKQGTTSKTLLRLVEKEFLSSKKNGRKMVYTVIITEDEYLEFETDDFFTFIHENSLTSIVSTLQNSKKITDEDLNELEKWINNR